jgi:hypothetical protein
MVFNHRPAHWFFMQALISSASLAAVAKIPMKLVCNPASIAFVGSGAFQRIQSM